MFLGLDVGSPGKTFCAILRDQFCGPWLLDIRNIGVDVVPTLVEETRPKCVAIDAPISWDIECNNGFRPVDNWLKQVRHLKKGAVMSTNSMMAVPIRGYHFASEFAALKARIIETHPQVVLQKFINNGTWASKMQRAMDAYKKDPDAIPVIVQQLDRSFLQGSLTTWMKRNHKATLSDDELDSILCALVSYWVVTDTKGVESGPAPSDTTRGFSEFFVPA